MGIHRECPMLLDDIINILSDSKGSLTDALLKTKVLLFQLGKKELITWVSSELTGYPEEGEVPPYRIVGGEVRGHIVSIAWQQANYKLPIMHLKDDAKKNVTEHKITMSIQSIEEAVKSFRTKGGGFRRNLPPEFGALIKEALNPGVEVNAAWCDLNMIEVENILAEVRSRLLDFTLELHAALGDNVPVKELPKKAEEIHADKIFHQTIYNTGPGTVVVGSSNIQVNNQQGDIEGLLAQVAKLGYQEAELEELRLAVIEDNNKNETPTVTDGETGKWFTKALKKVGKGAVDLGVDVVTGVIVKALDHYVKGS